LPKVSLHVLRRGGTHPIHPSISDLSGNKKARKEEEKEGYGATQRCITQLRDPAACTRSPFVVAPAGNPMAMHAAFFFVRCTNRVAIAMPEILPGV
jgi:hypothetical protein